MKEPKDIRILVACEESDSVRGRLADRGFDATSCDMQPSRNPDAKHYMGDVRDILYDGWDAMIGFPPCTHLAVSGAAHFEKKRADGRQQEGIDFFMLLANAPIPLIALENPVSIISSVWRKPDQVIQPYYFGDPVTKTTCLWLKGLPLLQHHEHDNLFAQQTHVYPGGIVTLSNGRREGEWSYKMACLPQSERAKARSKTFDGIADAMAAQWGDYILNALNK
jgi:hypothetical protein